MSWWPERERSFGKSVVALLGHLSGTAVTFVTLFSFAWAIGFVTEYLNSIHPFAPSILGIVNKVEVGILYADCALCGFHSLVGMWRFCKDVMR